MKKIKMFCVFAFSALMFSTSCTKEKEVVSPENRDNPAVTRTPAECNGPSAPTNLVVDPVGDDLTPYLNCLNDDGSVCLYTMPQIASYGPVDIYPNISDNNSNIWPGSNWNEAITLAQQVAQDGLNTVAWPTGATAIKIDRFEIIDDWVSYFNPNPYNPWIYKVNVKVYYRFCGEPGPGDDLLPGNGETK